MCYSLRRTSLATLTIMMPIAMMIMMTSEAAKVSKTFQDDVVKEPLVAEDPGHPQPQAKSKDPSSSRRFILGDLPFFHNRKRVNDAIKDVNKNKNHKKRLKVKDGNRPAFEVPKFVKRIMPLIAKPDKKAPLKKAKCGKSYEVRSFARFKVFINKRRSCNIIFRAEKGVSLRVNCRRISGGDCRHGQLMISDDTTSKMKYCSSSTKRKKLKFKTTELFISYKPLETTDAIASTPDIVCNIKGKFGDGYRPQGKQKCPLSCGKTSANAEVDIPHSPVPAFVDSNKYKSTLPVNASEIGFVIKATSAVPVQLANQSSVSITATASNSIRPTAMTNTSETATPLSSTALADIPGNVRTVVRIKEGKPANKGEWPWMLYIKVLLGGSLLPCGGAIISSKFVVTAAHCVYDVEFEKGDKVIVVANEYNTKKKHETKKISTKVDEIFLHPSYDFNTQTADIALLKLKKPYKFGEGVAPICIAPMANYEGKSVVIMGWGTKDYDTSNDPNILQEAPQTVANLAECAKNYSMLPEPDRNYPVTSKHLCTALPGIDSCSGDSGGPVQIQLGGSWYLLGIISFGHSCAHPSYPGVNTFVPSYANWIHKTIRKDKCR